jgi:hypothetical protein
MKNRWENPGKERNSCVFLINIQWKIFVFSPTSPHFQFSNVSEEKFFPEKNMR